jgi:hypothetical protein
MGRRTDSSIGFLGSGLTVHRLALGVHRSPLGVHRSPRSAFTVRRSPFTVWRSPFVVRRLMVFGISSKIITFNLFVMIMWPMDDFTQFDAFDRCRDFARGIAAQLNRGVFAKDPVLTTELRKTLLSVYSKFRGGIRTGRQPGVCSVRFDRKRIGRRNPGPTNLCS